jgi:DNA-binding XRE family transcriptional regulator
MVDRYESEEVWKPVVGYEGSYEVSSLGRVRSLTRLVDCKGGRKRSMSGKVMSVSIDHRGYRRVMLQRSGERKLLKVARVVCHAFNGGPEGERNQAAHCDGSRTNDRASNLRWATNVENISDRAIHGTNLNGERHHQSKLTETSVHLIRAMRAGSSMTNAEIAKRFGVARTTVSGICNNRLWAHLPTPLTILAEQKGGE